MTRSKINERVRQLRAGWRVFCGDWLAKPWARYNPGQGKWLLYHNSDFTGSPPNPMPLDDPRLLFCTPEKEVFSDTA
jgi:hypothetical protein